jgi:hypothetical protein
VPCCFTVPENSDRGKKRGILLEIDQKYSSGLRPCEKRANVLALLPLTLLVALI